MTFVLRMAMRETRASWRRLLFFFICIAVGVAAIVAMRSVIQSVRDVFGREARTLIAADVLISTTREWSRRTTTTTSPTRPWSPSASCLTSSVTPCWSRCTA